MISKTLKICRIEINKVFIHMHYLYAHLRKKIREMGLHGHIYTIPICVTIHTQVGFQAGFTYNAHNHIYQMQ